MQSLERGRAKHSLHTIIIITIRTWAIVQTINFFIEKRAFCAERQIQYDPFATELQQSNLI